MNNNHLAYLYIRTNDMIDMRLLHVRLLMQILLYCDQSLHHPSLKLNDTVNNHVKTLELHDLDPKYYCNRCYGKNNNHSEYLYIRTNDMIDRLQLYVCPLMGIQLCCGRTKPHSNLLLNDIACNHEEILV